MLYRLIRLIIRYQFSNEGSSFVDAFQPRRRLCRGSWMPRDVDPLRNWFRFPSKRTHKRRRDHPRARREKKTDRPPLEISSREIFDILSSVHGVRRLDLRLFHLNGSLRAYHSEKGRSPPPLLSRGKFQINSMHEKHISRVRLCDRNHR